MKYILTMIMAVLVAACGDKTVIKIEKPYYYVKYDTSGSIFSLAVNGFNINIEWDGEVNNHEEPINHLIRKKNNTLDLIIGDEEQFADYVDENFKSTIEIRVRGTFENKEVDYLITNFIISPDFTDNKEDLYKNSLQGVTFAFDVNNKLLNIRSGKGFDVSNITLGKTYHLYTGPTLRRTFDAVVDFPEWAFFSGEKIVELPITTEEQYDSYESLIQKEVDKVSSIFDTRDIEKIIPMFEMRSKEIDQAFYKEPGSTQNDIRHSLDIVLNERNLPQGFVSDDSFQFVTSLDGRLLSRVDAGNMAGTIFFDDEQTGTSTSYTIYWMRKDGEWIIAR